MSLVRHDTIRSQICVDSNKSFFTGTIRNRRRCCVATTTGLADRPVCMTKLKLYDEIIISFDTDNVHCAWVILHAATVHS